LAIADALRALVLSMMAEHEVRTAERDAPLEHNERRHHKA
jgi:hypothetical protein